MVLVVLVVLPNGPCYRAGMRFFMLIVLLTAACAPVPTDVVVTDLALDVSSPQDALLKPVDAVQSVDETLTLTCLPPNTPCEFSSPYPGIPPACCDDLICSLDLDGKRCRVRIYRDM